MSTKDIKNKTYASKSSTSGISQVPTQMTKNKSHAHPVAKIKGFGAHMKQRSQRRILEKDLEDVENELENLNLRENKSKLDLIKEQSIAKMQDQLQLLDNLE